MPRPLFDSPFIFGIHEPGGEHHMVAAGRPGWIVFTEGIGANPGDRSGKDFRTWSNQGLGILCRLNHGYNPDGTIPPSQHYSDFAQRCANYVAASPGCKIWIIGNEMNHPVERPGARIDWSRTVGRSEVSARGRAVPWRFNALQEETRSSRMALINPGEIITPQRYVHCYRQCREAIRRLPGHHDDQVLVGGVAPWNNLTAYDGNPSGDWVQYFRDILQLLGPQQCDGFTLHAYTHSPNPEEIYNDHFMGPPFQRYQYNFRTYRDFLAAVPANMRHLPAYITEADQDVPWLDQNNSWVQRAYGEIDHWNQQPGNQQIRALVLYRWPNIDRWVIEGKNGVIEDFRQVLQQDYRWREVPAPAPQPPEPKPPATKPKPPAVAAPPQAPAVASWRLGAWLEAGLEVNIRRSPGWRGKPDDDVLAKAPAGAMMQVISGPQEADGLAWWRVRHLTSEKQVVDGWAAQNSATGAALLRESAAPAPHLEPGASATTLDEVNLRRSPGFRGKPANDVLYAIPPGSQVTLLAGPQAADGVNWWQIRYASPFGNTFTGWAGEATASGSRLLDPVSGQPPAVPPPVATPPVATPPEPAPPARFRLGQHVYTTTFLNTRRSPGYVDKGEDDVLHEAPPRTEVVIYSGPQPADDLTWWKVRYVAEGRSIDGWMAEADQAGREFLAASQPPAPAPTPAPPAVPTKTLAVGQTVYNAYREPVNVRRTPGYLQQTAGDVIGKLPAAAAATIVAGPQDADALRWWRIEARISAETVAGWIAEVGPAGQRFLVPISLQNAIGLGRPFAGSWRVTQLFADRPAFYQQFSYDGVPLRGHNGIDFGTPNGTSILAASDGKVAQVGFEAKGFGYYVKLVHPWGESLYAHLKSVHVKEGAQVARGELLGPSDNTGNSSGPHLHFGIRVLPFRRGDGWGGCCDPAPFMNPDDLIIPDSIRSLGGMLPPPGMAPDEPGRERP